MTEDQRAAYIADYPECMTAPLPAGWNRLDTMPLSARRLAFLRANGEAFSGAPSNAAFLVDSQTIIGWRHG